MRSRFSGSGRIVCSAVKVWNKYRRPGPIRAQLVYLLVAIQLFLPICAFSQSQTFVPIPESDKARYHFNFEKLFYSNEAARKKDFEDFKQLTGQLAALKATATSSAGQLQAALELQQKMGIIAERAHVFGDLRYSVNTKDTVVQAEGQQISDEYDAATAFLRIAVQALSDQQIEAFLKSNPALEEYRFLLQTWRRDKPHTSSEAQETLLAQLSSRLNPFDSRFYTLMGARLQDKNIVIGNRTVNVTEQGGYNEILRAEDRNLRESGFRKRLAAYKGQSDIYAFSLFQKIKTANAVSDIHKFPNAVEESLYSYYLTPNTVDAVLKAFRDHASLTIRFQKAERAYQKKLVGLNEVEPWDLEVRPAGAPEPASRFSPGTISKRPLFGFNRLCNSFW